MNSEKIRAASFQLSNVIDKNKFDLVFIEEVPQEMKLSVKVTPPQVIIKPKKIINKTITYMDQTYYFECPNEDCDGMIQVPQNMIACRIFRHGSFKCNGQPMDPHTPKVQCDQLVAQKLIYGCGKPFFFDGKTVALSEYI